MTPLYSHRHRHVRSFHSRVWNSKTQVDAQNNWRRGCVVSPRYAAPATPDTCRVPALCELGVGVGVVGGVCMGGFCSFWASETAPSGGTSEPSLGVVELATGWTFLQTTFMACRQLYGFAFKKPSDEPSPLTLLQPCWDENVDNMQLHSWEYHHPNLIQKDDGSLTLQWIMFRAQFYSITFIMSHILGPFVWLVA